MKNLKRPKLPFNTLVLCARCNCYSTHEIWCERHYEQHLREWSCECGRMNGGSENRFQKKCGHCGRKRD